MKHSKRILSFLLALVLMISLCAGFASAADSDTKTVKMLCYNVAGLPSISGLMGQQGVNVADNQRALGKLLNTKGYDVIAVQEDFGYHCLLSAGLTNYRYKTIHSGGIPGGDGMNVFAKFPIYNAKRTAWNKASGVFNDGDELTPKGILYTVLDLGDGILVDFYVIHADAFDDAGSVAARNDNFRQLAALIQSKDNGRPVIVTGDFNTSSHEVHGAAFTQYMIKDCGFKDAWTELYNGGNYENYSGHSGASWGNWDSVEKFLYRDGKDVKVNISEFQYLDFQNKGVSISDHKAAGATVQFTKLDESVQNTGRLYVAMPNLIGAVTNKISVTLKDIGKILLHADELVGLLK